MAKHDIPAFVDYVRNYTNKKQISYAGHSQGNLNFFIATSIYGKNFTSKISHYLSISPVLTMSYVRNGASNLIDGFSLVEFTTNGGGPFLRFDQYFKDLIVPYFSYYFPRTVNNMVMSVVGRNFKR
jgi:hypothetical protein